MLLEDISAIDFDEFIETPSLAANSLKPLLTVLDWKGTKEDLIESLPHLSDKLSIDNLCHVMKSLGYKYRSLSISLNDIDDRLVPFLFVSSEDVIVVKKIIGEYAEIYSASLQKYTSVKRSEITGVAYFFSEEENVSGYSTQSGWLINTIKQYQLLLIQFFFIGIFLSILTISPAIFVMSVYDKVIATHDIQVLWGLLIGILLALSGVFLLQVTRTKILSYVNARMEKYISTTILKKLLFLSPMYTEMAPVGGQVARIKDFDTLREFLSGPILGILFDIPLLIVFFSAIAFLGGNLVFIPMLTLLTIGLLGFLFYPKIKLLSLKSSQSQVAKREFLVETLDKMRYIKSTGAEEIWRKRYREISGRATMSNYKVGILTATIANISEGLMYLTGILLIVFGALKVIALEMSIGALIAVMMIAWRLLAPIRAVATALTKADQIKSSFQQINKLIAINSEDEKNKTNERISSIKGQIEFHRVSMRYGPEGEPAILAANFELQSGELMMIVGDNGAGKSTMLRLAMGIYPLLSGSIRIDGCDVRQFHTRDLHRLIGYLPQQNYLFYGTILQNLQLSNPLLTEKEAIRILNEVGLSEDIAKMSEGIHTRIKDHASYTAPVSFQQRLSLARALVKNPKILLLDEPTTGLDYEAEKTMMKVIEGLKKKLTIIMVTHRPSHLEIADKVLMLEKGQIVALNAPN